MPPAAPGLGAAPLLQGFWASVWPGCCLVVRAPVGGVVGPGVSRSSLRANNLLVRGMERGRGDEGRYDINGGVWICYVHIKYSGAGNRSKHQTEFLGRVSSSLGPPCAAHLQLKR